MKYCTYQCLVSAHHAWTGSPRPVLRPLPRLSSRHAAASQMHKTLFLLPCSDTHRSESILCRSPITMMPFDLRNRDDPCTSSYGSLRTFKNDCVTGSKSISTVSGSRSDNLSATEVLKQKSEYGGCHRFIPLSLLICFYFILHPFATFVVSYAA